MTTIAWTARPPAKKSDVGSLFCSASDFSIEERFNAGTLVRSVQQALRSGAFVFARFAVASFFVATNFLIEWILRRLDDPRLLDMIPWRYVFDLIDLGLVGVFGVMGLVEAIRVFRGEHE